MTKLKPGDKISLKINGSKVVSPNSEYTEIRTFDIIGVDYDKYYLFVPDYMVISETIKIDRFNFKNYKIDPKFIGENALYIPENRIFKIISSLDGMFCDYCKDFYNYSVPNEGDKFVCWSCKNHPYRKLSKDLSG